MSQTTEQNLRGLRVAMLATDGVEQIELLDPRRALEEAGAEVTVVSPKAEQIQGMNHDQKGQMIQVDQQLSDADIENFDALVLPGGVANPDNLRIERAAIDFIGGFVSEGKPIAAICHGPWTLIDAGGVKGKDVTSWPSLKMDLMNAGAHWHDKQVVVAEGLVTSRKPDDLPAFNREMIKMFATAVTHEPA